MKGKKVLIAAVILLILVGMLWFGLSGNKSENLVDPQIPTPSETPTPPQAPKTFQFDSSTDLKMELEKVNPEVLESDFSENYE